MKFSEAMLLGLPEIEFSNSCTLDFDETCGDRCTGCLVGAAMWAEGRRKTASQDHVSQYWPKLSKVLLKEPCGVCGYLVIGNLWEFCTHYAAHYEDNQITAQEIADLIRQFEPDEEEACSETRSQSLPQLLKR
jgi:hypothetical protein